jgi:exopolysaccharide production protein ExoQ
MKRLEWLFHILVFAVQCNALLPLLARSGGSSADLGDSNPANTLAMAMTLGVVVLLVLRNPHALTEFASGMWPVLLLVALALLSTLWSDYPSVTIRRAGSLATAALWAWYLVARYDLDDVVLLVRQAIGILALFSLALGAVPGLGRASDGWLGAFSTKNDLGIVTALGSATFIYALIARRPRPLSLLFSATALMLCIGLLYLSQSRTSWLAAMLGAVICVAIRATYKRVGFGVIVWSTLLLLIVPAIVIASDQLGTIATMLGKDSTLTGRADLWLMLPTYIAQAPWLGHGYAAFWVKESVNVFQIWTTVGWEPPHAHDGWLDILLDLGIAGFLLTATQVIMILVNGVRAVVRGEQPDSQYILVITFVILIINLAESALVRPGAPWVLLVIGAAGLAKMEMKHRAVVEMVKPPRIYGVPKRPATPRRRRMGWPTQAPRPEPTHRRP